MCEDILLRRYDDTPWGFRLTGGHDFGIPLTVVRVTGGSLAEEAGMFVGDMIIEINNDPTAQITHSEAQQCILEAGNTINFAVLRGSPVPAITPTRGLYTPSVIDRATSSVGSIIEHESIQSSVNNQNSRENVEPAGLCEHEMTEEEIAEKLLENAEIIENNGKNVIGVNFKRFVPKCDFIKNSLVFQTLQEEQIFDQKSEQEQLKKCPTKRFSTFLTPPNLPKIKPPEKKKLEETKKSEAIEVIKNSTNKESSSSCERVCINCKCKLVDIEDITLANNETKQENNSDETIIQSKENTEEINKSDENEKDTNEKYYEDNVQDNYDNNQEFVEGLEDTSLKSEIVENVCSEPENNFEKSLKNIQDQLDKQLLDLLSKKVTTNDLSRNNIEIFDELDSRPRKSSWVEVDENCQEEAFVDDEDLLVENPKDEDLEFSETSEGSKEETEEYLNNKIGQDYDDNETTINKPIYPLTPLPRPIVLPGGRKWRCPDAYNEEFIAETLISQAEVLVGSTLGVNFRKYEPPKFDVSNSAVYKLVHNIKTKTGGGIENRPEKVEAEEDFYYHKPIDARQFYLATLPQPPIVSKF